MTNDRLYGEKMTAGEALNEIRRNAGTQFDKEIAEILINVASHN
jgi:HD-GYP domain-containing protein (c-di-GMP phosphodiesterase class II)